MAQSGTVLIAVRDQVLADSLRFSLEVEGYEAKLCEPPIDGLAGGSRSPAPSIAWHHRLAPPPATTAEGTTETADPGHPGGLCRPV